MEPANPLLGRSVRLFAAFTSFVLFTTCVPFVTPVHDPAPWWPWPLAPFNARFLAAVYIAQTIDVLILLRVRRWSPARLILSMGVAFSLLAGATTFLHLDVFDFSRPSAPFWLFFLAFTLAAQAYYLWTYRRLRIAGEAPSRAWQIYLLLQAAVLGGYGVFMLFAPSAATSFWPWPVDTFHAQVYSAVFISGALGIYLLSRISTDLDFLTIGLSHAAFGFFAVLGTVLVDAAVHRVNWAAAGTWLWVALFAWLCAAGLVMTWYALNLRRRNARYA